ncbi:MAG: RsmD family RNA methyltransferase, partial [Lachnospiraceae bacterium]|nr:RsmD family RNA methyltransferase [Lachnospiraceae bacterium]
MRVIAGEARSLPLKTVPSDSIRPTTDKTKETLFNILSPRIPGCRFLDLFSGSGAIAIEALSRGASYACLVENYRPAIRVITENLNFTKMQDKAELIKEDVRLVLRRLEGRKP